MFSATTWAILLIVLHLGAELGSNHLTASAAAALSSTTHLQRNYNNDDYNDVDYDDDDCEMQYNWSSPYVKAYLTDHPPLQTPLSHSRGAGCPITPPSANRPSPVAGRRKGESENKGWAEVYVVNVKAGERGGMMGGKGKTAAGVTQPGSVGGVGGGKRGGGQPIQVNLNIVVANDSKTARRQARVGESSAAPRAAASRAGGQTPELIFVLGSSRPVIWKINPKGIASDQHCQFWVSNNSRVIRDARLNMTTHKIDSSPSNLTSLLDWVQASFAPSSAPLVSETSLSDNVTIVIGGASRVASSTSRQFGGGDANRPCSTLSLGQQGHVIQTTNGCVARWNEGINNKDVHILELWRAHSNNNGKTATAVSSSPEKVVGGGSGVGGQSRGGSSPSSPLLPVVTVDIHPKGRPSRRKHLLLVLKSHRALRWRVQTRGLRGTLVIITDQSVDTDSIDIDSVQVVNEPLTSLAGLDLVAWTKDKYGHAVSYTEIEAANLLDITVDGGDHLPAVNPKWQLFDDGAEDEDDEEEEYEDADENDERREAVKRALSSTCSSDSMVVSLRKSILERASVRGAAIALSDDSCRVGENLTHYFWEVRTGGWCGTMQRKLSDGITYDNIIKLMALADEPRSQPSRRRGTRVVGPRTGSAKQREQELEDDDVVSSGDTTDWGESDYGTLVDDEDVRAAGTGRKRWDESTGRFLEPVIVSCTYHANEGAEAAGARSYYRMRFFADDSYTSDTKENPVRLVLGQTVYGSISFANGGVDHDAVLIQGCIITAERSPLRQHRLIENGCPVDDTVSWLTNDDQPPQRTSPDDLQVGKRFKFAVGNWWAGDVEANIGSVGVKLSCTVTPCSRAYSSKSSSELLKCTMQSRHCSSDAQGGAGRNDRRGGAGLSSLEVSHSWHLVTSVPITVRLSTAGNQPQPSIGATPSLLNQGSHYPVVLGGAHGNAAAVADGSAVNPGSSALDVSGAITPCEQVIHVEGLDSPTVVGIAFAAFFIGISLTGAIWYIHTCTALPIKKSGARSAGLRLADTSGESTPCSTAPMTIRPISQRLQVV